MSDIRTHYVVVADDAPECVIRKAVHIKAKILDTDTHINEIKVVRQNELRRYHSKNRNGGE